MDGVDLSSHVKVITVDDSLLVAQRMEDLFETLEGISYVGHARNSGYALHLLRKKKPDVVILDIHLEEQTSGASGITLLKTIREQYPDILTIMLTNATEEQYRTKCMNLGANFYLDKSNDFERLPTILNNIKSDN